MKHTRLAAALIAVFTAVMPLSGNVNVTVPCTAYAEGSTLTDSVEWIPKSFDDALDFRNTYGAVHIENGVLCVVFQREYEPLDTKNLIQFERYKLSLPGYNGTISGYDMRGYTHSDNPVQGDTELYVIVLSHFSKGEFSVELEDRNINSSIPDQRYSFSVDDECNITETDIYSWLPDCEEEFRNYSNSNTYVSAKDNYVVFCLSHNAGTAYDWSLNDKGEDCFELAAVSDCSTISAVPLDGEEINTIFAYKAIKDGYDKISYDFGAVYTNDGEIENTLAADCVVIDDAQTVLLSGDMRVTLMDYDTGELLTLPEGAIPRIWTDISKDTSEGKVYCNMQPFGLINNPDIVGLGHFFDEYNFSFGLVGDNLPIGYSRPDTEGRHPGYYNGTVVPDGYMSVKKYDNGTADVVFRLKKKSASEKPAKITFYDADTGELIDDPRYDEDFHLLKCKKDDPSESERFGFTSNPCTIVSGYLFDESCTCSFHFNTRYGQYDSIELNTISDDAECTELTCRMKWTPSGDANRDGSFSIADLVLLQEWLQGKKNTCLYDWKTVDYCRDNSIDVFDLVLMRKALIKSVKLPVAITINEKGGYDDVNKTYKVYRENNRYLLYYDEIKKDMDIEPLYMEISKQDYRDIMSQDYNRLIENYKDPITPAPDAVEYTSVLTYSDGSKAETKAYMANIVYKLDTLIDEYLSGKNAFVDVMPDYRVPYGSPFIVIEDGLTLYSGPGKGYRTIDTISEGERLFEIGYNKNNDTWLFTEYNGRNGWIKIVKDDNETPTIRYEVYADKPVIYLYPEAETDVHVELELTEAELSTTYPKYNNGWDVTASPDGSLLNKADGSHHKYLFWDAVNCRTRFDFSEGFCVAGNDTESFLKEKLTYMGLTEEEMNEFIVYWLPLMEHNKYNLIAFQGDAYTNSAKLNITPTPDSLLRIFMTYIPLEEAVDIEPQQFETFERKGFTVVEWGGSEIKS